MTGNFRQATWRLLLLAAVAINATATQAASDTDNRLAQLERASGAHSQVLTTLQQQVSANQTDIDTLRGQIQESQYQLQQVIERQRQILLQLDTLVNGQTPADKNAAPLAPAPENPSAALQSSAAPQSPAAPKAPAKPAVNTPPNTPANTSSDSAATAKLSATVKPPAAKAGSGKETEDYQAAMALLANGLLHDTKQNSEARTAFENFVSRYPKSKSLPDAVYWIGELNYRDNKQDTALYYFARVAKEYPKSAKAAESLYKVGVIMQGKGKKTQAKAVYNQVIRQYPKSEGAKMAKKKLTEG